MDHDAPRPESPSSPAPRFHAPLFCPACGTACVMEQTGSPIFLGGDETDPDSVLIRLPTWYGRCGGCGWRGQIQSSDERELRVRDPEEPMVLSTPGVCGGSPRLANTRIMIWLLVESRHRLGKSDAELLKSYPTIQQRHLDAAWVYYEQHKGEIDAEIQRQDEEPDPD